MNGPTPGAAAGNRRRWAALRLAMMVAVASLLWLPHYAHFAFDRSPVASQLVDTQTHQPSDAVLAEVASMSLAVGLEIPPEDVVATADGILAGELAAPAFLDAPLRLAGYPADFLGGSVTFQLVMASLEVERVLLEAHARTGNDAYLRLALERVLGFARVDAQARDGMGFLWNDHAIAARVAPLVRLWQAVRQRPEIDARDRQALVSLAARSGRLLADPGHFTVRTNHGVMQNLALLQLAAAFPALPEAAQWRTLAMERLELQLAFYVSDEGMVLEHSAGYHALGSELLTYALRLAALNGIRPPDTLAAAADASRRVLAELTRPDGTLPLFGNTARVATSPPGLEAATPPPAMRLLPLSGYAYWLLPERGAAGASHTVVAWAKHERHGHKHADEPSVHLWSEDTDWITAAGYWPYGHPRYRDANGWRGSNAPHLPDEDAQSPRQLTLRHSASSGDLRFVEVQRSGPGETEIRRQILQLGPARLVVLDFVRGTPTGTETLWTSDARLAFERVDDTTVLSAPNTRGTRLRITSAGNPAAELMLLRASEAPFGGWVMHGRLPTPAPSLLVRQDGPEAVHMTAFELLGAEHAAAASPGPRLSDLALPDNWEVVLTEGGRELAVRRVGQALFLGDAQAGTGSSIGLVEPPDVGARRTALRQAMQTAVERFPPWRDLAPYRLKLTVLVLALALVAELAWWALRRHRIPLGAPAWHVGLAGLWAGVAFWAHFVYLQT